MSVRRSDESEKAGVEAGAALMAVAARTAPKTRGLDSVKTLILTGEDLEGLARAMERKGEEKSTKIPSFTRDAGNVRTAAAVMLIGVSRLPKRPEIPLNCGACGYGTCAELLASGEREGEDFTGPACIFQGVDLGIALGSAVKLAAGLGIDNRIMYTIGAAAKKMGLLDSDIVIGVPLSVTGKSPYFDRP
jgi:uncharacterized ferredoxin-like protein